MKKIISILTIIALLVVGLFTFSGCEDSEKESKKSSSKKDSVVTEKDDEDEDEDKKSDKDEEEDKKSDKDDEDEDEDKKSDKDDEDEDEDKKSDKDDEDEDEDKNSDKDDEDEDKDKNSDKDDKEEDEDKKTEDNKTNTNSNANLGSKYVDLDNRSFSVNGKVYKLGVNTLQDMINDGVPFDEDDIANASNNINKNSSSQSFRIELGDYYTCSVYVSNFTNENKKILECPITEIYLPVRKDEKQDVVSFAFPLNITEEQLLNNAGTPTDKSEYNGDNGYVSRTYKYTKESTKYYGNSGYTFEYINGELRYVRMNYKE